mgnify:CR=1 FL=1
MENTGFNNHVGFRPEYLERLCRDLPECTVCLDIAHVQDFADLVLAGFIANPGIRQRIREIHFSYSTILLQEDIYATLGYPGYGPYHALYSLTGVRPDPGMLEFIRNFPIVLEGVVPLEDQALDFLRAEMAIALGAGLAAPVAHGG